MKLSFLLLLFFSQSAIGQTFKGLIVDSTTQQPVPYASIGIENTDYGTISDSVGAFFLSTIPDSAIATVKISHIGYFDKYVTATVLSKMICEGAIQMLPRITDNNTIIIRAQKATQFKIIGNFSQNAGSSMVAVTFNPAIKSDSNSISQNRGRSLGRAFKWSPKKTGKLQWFKFNINSHGFKYVKFRIGVMDKNTHEDILNKDILYTYRGDKGAVKIDLRNANIYINRDFIVYLEWLTELTDKHSSTYYLSIPASISLSTSTLTKPASQAIWKQISNSGIHYQVKIAY